MYQDWNLIQQDTAAQAKIEEEQRAEREAKERLDAEAALADEDDEVVVEKKKVWRQCRPPAGVASMASSRCYVASPSS